MRKAVKAIERSYLLCFLLMALLVGTVTDALIVQHQNADRAYTVALENLQLAQSGVYATTVYSCDMTVYNWVISAESAALAIALNAQFKKKARNNTDQYIQEWIMKFKDDPNFTGQMPSIIQAYLTTNTNN